MTGRRPVSEARLAEALQSAGNELWREVLGEPGEFGGFQVEPIEDCPGLYRSKLWGGRCIEGPPAYVARCQALFVRSRARKGKPGFTNPGA